MSQEQKKRPPITEEERQRRIERLRRERRRKRRQQAMIMRAAVRGVLILILIGSIALVSAQVRRSKAKKAEEKAKQEKLIQEEEAKNKQRKESIDQADVMAQGYDYDGAIELLKSLDNYDKDADIVAKIAGYEADKSTLVAVNMNEITHIFYHSLVVDPERGFAGNDSAAAGFKQWMTTVDEFNKITQAMYDNGYVLIDLHDMVTETTDENGAVHFTTNQIMLPEGKKPFVLSLDDLSYYHSYDGRGVASKIVLDENGKPVELKAYDRNVATKLIEDFMLLANETVAEDYYWQEMPFVYRVHEAPDDEKIRALATFINNFGYSMHITDEIHPKELQKLLEKIAGSDEENLISRLTLRSMKKAKYTAECIGHFGLAAKYYCHFTSPIRRYPDLQIHRIIKECLHGGMSEKRKLHYDKILPDVAEQASATERRADEAERDTDKLKMVQYMSAHIGEYFDGVISGVTNWGIYVELPNTIEGMVSVNNMRGYYVFDENHYEMFNETTHQTYKLGQKVRVVVVDTNEISRTIDFMFAQDYEE